MAFRKRLALFSVVGLLVVTAAADETAAINAEDVHRLDEHHGGGLRLVPWRDGMAIQVDGTQWVTTTWPDLGTKELKMPSEYHVVDLARTQRDHYVFARKPGSNAVFRLENDQWVSLELPEETVHAKELRFIPGDVAFALNAEDLVWWRKDNLWRKTRVGPCPSTIPAKPAGDVQFVRGNQLIVGTHGGEFGSTFGSYNLFNQEGPWTLVWRGGLPVQQFLLDAKGTLWTYAQLSHLAGFTYGVWRLDLKGWKPMIEASPGSLTQPAPGERHRLLQSDVRVIDVAAMPDDRLALLTDDFGIYARDSRQSEGHPLLIDLPSMKIPGGSRVYNLQFDGSGNAYVIAGCHGVLVFHKPEEGPWRVKQVQIAEKR